MRSENDKKYMCRLCPRQDDDYSLMMFHAANVHGRFDYEHMIIEVAKLPIIGKILVQPDCSQDTEAKNG
jgi:hypothetical protein